MESAIDLSNDSDDGTIDITAEESDDRTIYLLSPTEDVSKASEQGATNDDEVLQLLLMAELHCVGIQHYNRSVV